MPATRTASAPRRSSGRPARCRPTRVLMPVLSHRGPFQMQGIRPCHENWNRAVVIRSWPAHRTRADVNAERGRPYALAAMSTLPPPSLDPLAAFRARRAGGPRHRCVERAGRPLRRGCSTRPARRWCVAARRQERLEALAGRPARRGAPSPPTSAETTSSGAAGGRGARALRDRGRPRQQRRRRLTPSPSRTRTSTRSAGRWRSTSPRCGTCASWPASRWWPRARAASSTSRRCSASSAPRPIKQAHYVASKGAVVTLTKELALQWARKGVRVNALCPGWFPSEMTAGMESDEGSQRFITAQLADPPHGRGARARRAPAPPGQRRRLVHDRALPRGRRRLARSLTGPGPAPRSCRLRAGGRCRW